MVQVRCPECGFLQSMSEERFMSISDDFIDCPHCRSKVPKEWVPTEDEGVPEEAAHKILAFSRRILNGGVVTTDVVHALESLVRHFGSPGDSEKALGIGYAGLGETKKAEGFLELARERAPDDVEVLRALLQVRLALESYESAVEVGRDLVDHVGRWVEDEDVAGLALAYIRLGRVGEAETVLHDHPGLDTKNPMVRKARKELERSSGTSIKSLIGEWGTLNKMVVGGASRAMRNLAGKAMRMVGSPESRTARSYSTAHRYEHPDQVAPTGSLTVYDEESDRNALVRLRPRVEYWIYAASDTIPDLDSIKARMARQAGSDDDGRLLSRSIDARLRKKELSVDYLFREDAPELFDYPDDLIPRNSRGLPDDERRKLKASTMIIRIRVRPLDSSDLWYLGFSVAFAEAVRDLCGGIVQDAASHTLWGTGEWLRMAENCGRDDDMVDHLQFHVLEEGKGVWIHSHGMHKFGIPEVEIESVPHELAAAGLETLKRMCLVLIEKRMDGIPESAEHRIANSPFLFLTELKPADDEGHFPGGRFTARPFLADYDPYSPDTLRHALRLMESRVRMGVKQHRDDTGGAAESTPVTPPAGNGPDEARRKFLEARDLAKGQFEVFKRSFLETGPSEELVHAVKVGFPASSGRVEWMWVSLDAWEGSSVKGSVENTPVLRTDLGKGSRVEVTEDEIFDWLVSREGTIVKGGFTEGLKEHPDGA